MLAKGGAVLAGAMLALTAVEAQAQNIVATPESVSAELVRRGYKAERITGKERERVQTADSGMPITITFYNCKQGKAGCTTVQFYTGFTDINPSLEQLNAWNAKVRWVRAYIDSDDDPVLEMDVDMDFGGLSRALFWDNFQTYLGMVGQFRQEFGR